MQAVFFFAVLLFAKTSVAQNGAIVAKTTLSFSGNNIIVDSFNSADANFSTGGLYDSTKARNNGDLICFGTNANCVAIGNSVVFGHVVTGSNGTASVGNQGTIGSATWQATNTGIEPNGTEGQTWYGHYASLVIPDMVAPFGVGQSPGPPVDIVTGTPGSYVTNHYDHSLTYGDYYDTGTLSGKTIALGVARLFLPTGLNGTQIFTVATNGDLQIFVGGTTCTIGGVANLTGKAWYFSLFCLGSVNSVSATLASDFIGTIYAPSAAMTIGTSGSPVYNFSGSVMAQSVSANGRVHFHYDESLGGVWSQAPRFTTQPQSQSIVAGQAATFTVAASGATPLSYQWRLNGTNVPGATNTALGVTNATLSSAGKYSVAASNAFGMVTSSNAVLTVTVPPAIVQQPVSQAGVLNSNVVFSVVAAGSGPLIYEWRMDGQVLAVTSNSSFVIASMQASNAGIYSVVVTNAGGSVTSAPATLSVAVPPDFLWARTLTNYANGNWGVSHAGSLSIDGSGNLFVAGYYVGWGVDFGGMMLTNNNSFFLGAFSFICKYDQWGNFQWANLISTNSGTGVKTAVAPDGSLFVAGSFKGTATFGSNVLTASGFNRALYVAKYNSQGRALWGRMISATDPYDNGQFSSLATDTNGNVYLLNSISGSADFGTMTVSGTPALLAKYTSSGDLAWAKGVNAGAGVSVGASGSIYVCSLIFTKYDSDGNVIWTRPFPYAQSITLDNDENFYTTGSGNGTYGDLTVTNVGSAPDCFVAKCDSNGNLIWSRQLGSTKQQTGVSIALDAYRNVYVSSISGPAQQEPSLSFGNTVLTNAMSMVLKYDSAGNPLWARALGGTNRAQGVAVAVLNPGAVFVAGTFYCSAQFGSFNLVDGNLSCNGDLYAVRLAGIEPPASAAATLTSAGLAAGNQVQFQVAGVTGFLYVVEASTNLRDWVAIATNTAPFTFTDSQSAAFPQRFYRVAWSP